MLKKSPFWPLFLGNNDSFIFFENSTFPWFVNKTALCFWETLRADKEGAFLAIFARICTHAKAHTIYVCLEDPFPLSPPPPEQPRPVCLARISPNTKAPFHPAALSQGCGLFCIWLVVGELEQALFPIVFFLHPGGDSSREMTAARSQLHPTPLFIEPPSGKHRSTKQQDKQDLLLLSFWN